MRSVEELQVELDQSNSLLEDLLHACNTRLIITTNKELDASLNDVGNYLERIELNRGDK